jgi:hypothetical protein
MGQAHDMGRGEHLHAGEANAKDYSVANERFQRVVDICTCHYYYVD